MRGFNKVILAGNLTRDPEVRATTSGSSVTGFTIAVNRRWKSASGEMQESTSFIDCSAWGRPGETIKQYMRKGSPILISGRLDQHSWEDKTTGQKRSRLEVTVDDFNFLGSGDGAAPAPEAAPSDTIAPAPAGDAPAPAEDDGPIDVSEIPF